MIRSLALNSESKRGARMPINIAWSRSPAGYGSGFASTGEIRPLKRSSNGPGQPNSCTSGGHLTNDLTDCRVKEDHQGRSPLRAKVRLALAIWLALGSEFAPTGERINSTMRGRHKILKIKTKANDATPNIPGAKTWVAKPFYLLVVDQPPQQQDVNYHDMGVRTPKSELARKVMGKNTFRTHEGQSFATCRYCGLEYVYNITRLTTHFTGDHEPRGGALQPKKKGCETCESVRICALCGEGSDYIRDIGTKQSKQREIEKTASVNQQALCRTMRIAIFKESLLGHYWKRTYQTPPLTSLLLRNVQLILRRQCWMCRQTCQETLLHFQTPRHQDGISNNH
ncbi:hypothetical protein R1sor_002208 [Riccia sorocarpa]|uniref:C2H2-type domain-containing protein n=1 Tax=Riccia sorocarpa TaxID=122646 RepID=A0ABD3GZS9_9MARC